MQSKIKYSFQVEKNFIGNLHMNHRLCLFWLQITSRNTFLEMRVFGCAWKINFSEIIFSWPGVLKALTQKWFEVKIFTLNHFRTHAQRERERERERAFNFNFADLRTHRSTNRSRLRLRRSTNPRTSLRPRAFSPWAFDFAGDPEPSCHEPTNWSLSLSLYLSLSLSVWFWSTHEPLISDFFVVVVVVLVVVFWWFSYCVVVGFVWVVMENSIFRMLPNTWKYFLEQFS